MARNAQDNDGLKEAARRSSDVMGAFAARRHSGMGASDFKGAERAAAAARGGSSAPSADESNARDEAGHQKPGARTRLGGEDRSARTAPAQSKRRSKGRHAKPEQRHPKTLAEFISQNSVFIVGVSAVVIAVVILIAILRIVMPQESGNEQADTSSTASEQSSAQASSAEKPAALSYDYDWGNLEYADGRYAYVVGGKTRSRTGVDISDHQPGADWGAVAADGIDFAIVRLGYRGATEGVIHLDEQYEANIDGAQAAGLDCGVYYFSQAATVDEAVEEADFVVKSLDGRKLQYPVVYDFETSVNGIEHPRTEKLSADELVKIAKAFRKRVEDAGYSTMLYGNGYDLDRYTTEYLGSQAVWWAEYGPDVPSYDGDIAMWQYTSGGEVAGINGGADLSIDLRGVTN